MRILAALFLMILIGATSLSAQDSKLPQSGSAALQFHVLGLGQFGVTGPFAGSTTLLPLFIEDQNLLGEIGLTIPVYGIGGKMFLSDAFALRASLGLNYTAKSTDTTFQNSDGDTVNETQTDNLFVGAFAPGFEYHFAQTSNVSAYIGGVVSYTSGVKATGPNDGQSSDVSSVLMLGPVLGAEFFPWNNFSFGAEYMLAYSSISTSTKVGDDTFDGPSYTYIQTGNFAVRASLYFD